MRTGILGGTFDPIHIAHLHAAECALHQIGLDRVLIIPAGDPWQKADEVIAPGEHRLQMCRVAIAGVAGLEVDDRELNRDGPTYTIDTLESFPGDEELFLILGTDVAAGIRSWHRWHEVLDRVTLVLAPRLGISEGEDSFERAINLDMGPLDVSATDIRERIRRGLPYRYLVTGPVHAYIDVNGLYAKAPGDDMVVGLNSMEDSS